MLLIYLHCLAVDTVLSDRDKGPFQGFTSLHAIYYQANLSMSYHVLVLYDSYHSVIISSMEAYLPGIIFAFKGRAQGSSAHRCHTEDQPWGSLLSKPNS